MFVVTRRTGNRNVLQHGICSNKLHQAGVPNEHRAFAGNKIIAGVSTCGRRDFMLQDHVRKELNGFYRVGVIPDKGLAVCGEDLTVV